MSDYRPDIAQLGDNEETDNSKQQQRIQCPCCHGQRTQFSTKSGMREICPGCEGRGWIHQP